MSGSEFMIARRACLCTFLLAVLAATSCAPAGSAPLSGSDKEEAQAVERAFEAYRAALLSQDGKAAAEHVSSSTIKMYQEHRDLAVRGDEVTVKNLSVVNRMQVLLLRHRIEPKLLKGMDGKAAFAHAVDQNWIGKDGVVRVGLEGVAVSGPRATARATTGGEQTTAVFHFVKEGEAWKLDLVPTFKALDQVFQQRARDKGMSEDEFIFSVLTSLSGRKVTDAIWQPLEELP